jgi:hypothetical protein
MFLVIASLFFLFLRRVGKDVAWRTRKQEACQQGSAEDKEDEEARAMSR